MEKEMNNLKVLGLIQDQKIVDEECFGSWELGKDKFNTLLVEDVKNKAQYYIHIDIKERDDIDSRVNLTIEPAKEEKLMTHLPKDETYIEGFAIDPRTLNYTYDMPKEEDIYEDPNDPDLVPDIDDFEDTIVNNVFACRLKEGLYVKAYVAVNENLFTQNPNLPTNKIIEVNEALEEVRRKLHRDKTVNIDEDKKSGNILLNKKIMEEKYLKDDDKLAMKRPGKTRYNKSLMKIFRNRNPKGPII